MSGNIDRRLAKLESEKVAGKTVIIWRGCGETADHAIVSRFPGGAPRDARLLIVGWLDNEAAA
jgi:hypothetical protein